MDRQTVEELVVQAFIIPEKRQRFYLFLSNPKRRTEILDRLNHPSDLDERYKKALLPSAQKVSQIYALLRSKGAPERCRVISSNEELDGKDVSLYEALAATVGYGHGTIISCIPAKLAYFEGEEMGDRCILER